jgi:hypothetical protein
MNNLTFPKWMAILMACVALCVFSGAQAANPQAQAANPVPDKTGAFVTYCASHFADCQNKVVVTEIGVMADKVFANNPDQVCVIPKGIDNDAATREILAWLGKHKEVEAMKTEDGIQAAVKDLWHCQLQIGDGSVPGGPPAKTGAFVAYCPTHYAKCANEVVAVMASVMIPDPPEHCSPPRDITTKDMTTAVLGWLGQHKETYKLNTDDAIMASFDQLWPCQKKAGQMFNHKGHEGMNYEGHEGTVLSCQYSVLRKNNCKGKSNRKMLRATRSA